MSEFNTISAETLVTEYVTPETCVFAENPNGFLSAVIDGTEYKRVILTRSLPMTDPDDYICISNVEKKEIGIIEHISSFSDEQQKLIKAELQQRYFCPVISDIVTIKEKMGHFYFDVKVNDFIKSFTVKDLTKNVRYHGKGFDIIDVDGNRYRIEDFNKISSKSRKKIEAYLY